MKNWTTVHSVALGIAAFAASVPGLEAALPPVATPWLKGAQAIAIVVVAVLGAVSPSAKGDGGAS